MIAKVGASVQGFRAQHPRYFLASLVGGAVLFIVLLTGGQPTDFKDRFYQYSYPPTLDADTSSSALSPVSSIALGPRNLAAAVKRAEQLWKRSVAKREQFIKEQGGLEKMRMFSDKSWKGYGQMFTLWDVFLPSFPCPFEVERIGRMGDGGKFTCGLPRIREKRGKKCIVYSFGVERESSWEAEILERSDCEIYMYDFSVSTFGPQLQAMDPAMSSRAHFFQYGIGGKDEVVDGHQFFTLASLMKMNGHDWIDILKVDVEGAEFKMLPDVVADFGNGNLPFGQLLLEIHAERTEHAYATQEFGAWWKMLEDAGLRPFFSELNYPSAHWLPYPTAMELAFVNNCNGRAKCGSLLRD